MHGTLRNIILNGQGRLNVGDPFFAASGGTQPWYANPVDPPHAYFADTDTTWFSWQATSPVGAGGARHARVLTLNNATGRKSAEFVAGLFGLTDDDHGVSALVRDNSGYVHIFYWPHSGNMRCASTLNPNDPSVWRENALISGTYTYAHVANVAGVIYLFMRDSTDLNNEKLVLAKTTSITAGVPTFGAAVTIVDLSSDSRAYMGSLEVVGTDIHFVLTRANAADTVRKNVYYFVYDTVADQIRDFDSTVHVGTGGATGAFPVTLTQANASFKLFTHGGDPDETTTPGMCIDTLGHPHVIFSSSANAIVAQHLWHNGTAWQSPVALGDVSSEHAVTIYPMASGKVAAVWAHDDDALWSPHGGNLYRAERVSGGSWTTAQKIATADPTRHGLSIPIRIRNGTAKARIAFAEVQKTGAANEDGALRMFAWGDNGYVRAPAYIHTYVNSAQVHALLDRFSPGPTTQQRVALYDAVFTKLNDIGIASFDAFYPLAAEAEQNAYQNLIANAYNLTLAGGAYTFTPNRGFTNTQAGGAYVLATGFIPSSAGGAMTRDSAHLGIYCHVNQQSNGSDIGANDGTRVSFIIQRNTSNQVSVRLNTGTSFVVSNSGGADHFVAVRSASNANQIDKGGAQLGTNAQASTGLVQAQINILFSQNQRASIAHFGGSLSAAQRVKAYELAAMWNLAVGAF